MKIVWILGRGVSLRPPSSHIDLCRLGRAVARTHLYPICGENKELMRQYALTFTEEADYNG